MKLTESETKVWEDLKSGYDEGDDRDGWRLVYLDNVINTSDKSVRGVLGSLEKKGLYEREDGYAWGSVKTNSN